MPIKQQGLLNVVARNSDVVFSALAVAGMVGNWVFILS